MSVDKENTFRTLADKPLLAKKQWHCACGIHTWLPWNDPRVNKRGSWTYVEQFRSCGYCNKVQRREISKD